MRTKTAKKKKNKNTTMKKRKIISSEPRIVILDNDGTTGAYDAVFMILDMIFESKNKKIYIQSLIPSLTDLFIKTNTFRPGLVKLIKTLYMLRGRGLLDAVVMYTYQNKSLFFDSHGQQICSPTILDYCFGYIATGSIQPFCNIIIARDEHRKELELKETDDLGAKSIELVLRKLNMQPTTNLRGIIFIDDCHYNMPNTNKYKLGKLTNMYISPYNNNNTVNTNIIIDNINIINTIYKTKLYKYIPKSIYSKHIDNYFSLCVSNKIPYKYNDTNLTKLALDIQKYYVAGKF